MALAANALVTLAKTKLFVGVPSATVSEDEILEDFINAVSDLIELFCNRDFIEKTFVETRDGNRTQEMLLHQWPINALTEVKIDSLRAFGTESIIDITTFQVVNNERAEGVGIRRKDGTIFPRGAGTIQVTYDAGFLLAAIPNDVALACKIAVGYYYEKQQNKNWSVATKSKGDEDVSLSGGLPVDSTALLDKHVRFDIPGEGYPVVNS